MSPAVTVIIPVYNAVGYLDECIGSVLGQTSKPAQIILVDDGSTDGSDALCENWAQKDDRIQVVHQPNRGLSVARNRGLDLATGECIVFADADDALHPQFVERMSALIAGCDIARCGIVEGTAYRWPRLSNAAESADSASAIERVLYQDGWHNGVWAHMYRREMFDSLRFRERTLYEDLDVIYKIYERAAGGIRFTADRMYFYRQHADSILGSFTASRLQVLDVVDCMEEHFSDSPQLLAAARHRRFSAYFNMLGLMAKHVSPAQAVERCWPKITDLRRGVLTDPRSRLKNRVGALLSFLGPHITVSMSKYLIR